MDPKIVAFFSAGIGMAGAACGTAIGIGWLASRAMEGMARQPEAAGKIQTGMILAIAFIEAIALYALVVSLILATKV
ncbi:MAG: ATP synthase F0 subunit C [Candidatus Margulisbacteria bacterium]|jgi:F-type H+-transporting ATPase subunit c|nr:ATP synthase F0 subunit C [Candidatus Margulisiibacteriota bacterium]